MPIVTTETRTEIFCFVVLLLSCFSYVWLCDPMDCSQTPPSMGYFLQEYWRGLPFPSPGDLPDLCLQHCINCWATREAPSLHQCSHFSSPSRGGEDRGISFGMHSWNKHTQGQRAPIVAPLFIYLFIFCHSKLLMGFPGGSAVKNPSAMQETQETWIQSLHRADTLEKEIATHSNILAWKIPQTEELDRLQSMGSQRVGHSWARVHAVLRNMWDIPSKVFANYTYSYCIWLLLPPSCTMLREPLRILEATYTSFSHAIPIYLVSSPIAACFE